MTTIQTISLIIMYVCSVVISYYAFRHVLQNGRHWDSSDAKLMFILNYIPFINLCYSLTFLATQKLGKMSYKKISINKLVNKYFNINK